MTYSPHTQLRRRTARAPRVAIALAALLPAAAAQDDRPPAPPPLEVFRSELQDAVAHILVRQREHQFRLDRLDSLIAYFRSVGNLEKLRLVSELREREQDSFQHLMDEYRRLLGKDDYDRLLGVLRRRLEIDGLPQGSPAREPVARATPVPARDPLASRARASASERAAKVNARMAQVSNQQRARTAEQARRLQQQNPPPPSGWSRGQAPPAQRGAAPSPTRGRP